MSLKKWKKKFSFSPERNYVLVSFDFFPELKNSGILKRKSEENVNQVQSIYATL